MVVIYQTARRTGRVFILCGSYISDSKENWKGIYSVWQLYIRQQGELEGYLFCVVVIYLAARRNGRAFSVAAKYLTAR